MSGKTTKPRSDAQREASRRNGAKSRGPISDDGKARSRMNATKYGITAQSLVLCNESPDAYEELRQAYYKQFLPVGQAEIDLCDEMIAARWRIRRYSSIETALLDLEMLRDEAEVDRQYPGITSPMRCGLAFRHIARDDNALTLLSRREAQAQRAYKMACDTLMRMQANRPAEEPEEPENEQVQIEPENAAQLPSQQELGSPSEPPPTPEPSAQCPAGYLDILGIPEYPDISNV